MFISFKKNNNVVKPTYSYKSENENKNIIMFTTFDLKREIKSKTFIMRILIELCTFVKRRRNHLIRLHRRREDFSITFWSLNHNYGFMFMTLY